jgi:DNA-binding winged helix-turn-helix (wHTH) protein/Tol biopolymer transport system component
MDSHPTYRFADLTLDLGRRSLDRGGEPIELGKLTYELLVALVESAPNVLTHDDLVKRVWGGRVTSPETVQQRAKLLRDALHDDAGQPRYISVVRGYGYRLIPPVERSIAVRVNEQIARTVTAPATALSKERAVAMAATAILALAALAYFALSRLVGSDVSSLDYEITTIETPGQPRVGAPTISPNGKFVVYPSLDADQLPRILRFHQLATGSDVEILRDPARVSLLPTFSPDGDFIYYLGLIPDHPRALWRVPFIGNQPALQVSDFVSSPIGWSPDGKHGAFVRYDVSNHTSLVVRDARGEERELAKRTVPRAFISTEIGGSAVRPAWSPDGRLIALFELTDQLEPILTFVDVETGVEQSLDSQGGWLPTGIAWLGSSTLVLSQPAGPGQRAQLWRMSYPSGEVTPLTNGLSSFRGIDLDESRTRLVTQRQDRWIAVWVREAPGADFHERVPWTPLGAENVSAVWAGDRLLYDATFLEHLVIAEVSPEGEISPAIVPDAFQVTAGPDGETIVFSSPIRAQQGLWKTDRTGRPPARFLEGVAVEPVVTRDRNVVFVTIRSGVQSPWIVPLDGGAASEIAQDDVRTSTVDVSPDGRQVAFFSLRTRKIAVCDLPHCDNRVDLDLPTNFADILRWTPDGKALGYLINASRDIWKMPVDGGAPSPVTSFGPNGNQIATFAWSGDGHRLAVVYLRTEESLVMLSGLRP